MNFLEISTISAVIASLIFYVVNIYLSPRMRISVRDLYIHYKSIIPIYNGYILYKISWKTSVFWITVVLALIGGILNGIGNPVTSVIGVILNIVVIVIGIMQSYKLSKAFGHAVGFTVGLVLLPPIFTLILGFGSSEYIGVQE